MSDTPGDASKTEPSVAPSQPADVAELLQNLLIHRAELEVQNEELREARMRSESAERRLYVYYQLAPVGFLRLMPSGIILEANLLASEMLGVPRKLLLQGNTRLHPFIEAKDRQKFTGHLDAVFRSGRFESCELSLYRRDGQWLHVMVQSIARKDDPSAEECLATLTDISRLVEMRQELENATAHWRSLFEHGHDMILITDAQTGIILDANTRAEELLGMRKLDIVGTRQLDLQPREGAKHYAHRFEDASRGTGGFARMEFLNAKGDVIPVEMAATAFTTPKGRRVVQGVFRDLRPTLRMEQALKDHEEALRHLMKDRERMMMDLHDNLLQSLFAHGMAVSRVRNLLAQGDGAALGAELERLTGEVNQMLELTRRLLLSVSAPARKRELLREDLERVLDRVAGAAGAEAVVEVSLDVLPRISTNQAENILSIAREAASNAIRHGNARKLHCRLGLFSPNEACLVIEDDGVGIESTSGQGFGLSNIRSRAIEMLGNVRFESLQPNGTRVTVCFRLDDSGV